MQNMIWFLLWAIGPTIPAILLFRAIPKNKATVNGKFQGIEFKIGGAAALYFLVFFVMNPIKLGLINKDTQERWSLIASFKDENDKPIPVKLLQKIEAIPNIEFDSLDSRTVEIFLPTVYIDKNKNISLPYKLRLNFTGYETQSISATQFFDKKMLCDILWKDREIHMKNLPKLLARPVNNMETTTTNDTASANEIVVN